MTKKKTSLTVNADLNNVGSSRKEPAHEGPTIEQAVNAVTRQMETIGRRPRTINDYHNFVNDFAKVTGKQHLDEITVDSIYEWLSSMHVSNQTKKIRLKCFKAFLSHCFDNGWFKARFWRSIVIHVDTPVKEGATEHEVNVLLSMLDLGDFVQLRDAVAVSTMFQTGVRIGTLIALRESHIDLEGRVLSIDGSIVKNHEQLRLPIDDHLTKMLSVLIQQNELVREDKRTDNDFVFITKNGKPIQKSHSTNNIQKRLHKYATDYGLKNINPHALRRGFAKNLLDKGANIALISKALAHSDVAVTTRYLHIDKEEAEKSLRKYL